MIKKLDYFYNEFHEKIDISEKGIYWDTILNVFRHKFICSKCGQPLDCRCFSTIKSVIIEIRKGLICKDCGIKECLEETNPFDLIDWFDRDRENQARNYLLSIISKNAIFEYTEGEEINFDELTWFDLTEIVSYDNCEIYDNFKEFVISLMTEEEKEVEFYENCESYIEGYICEI